MAFIIPGCINCGLPIMLLLFGLVGLQRYLLAVAFPKISDHPKLYIEGIFLMLTFVIGLIEYLFIRTWFIIVTWLGIFILSSPWWLVWYCRFIKSEEKKLQEKKLHLRPPVHVQEPTPVQKEENLEVQSGRNWTKYLYATSYNSYSYYIC